ncbi:alpha/beta fold hydrolase [Streptomyces sp. NBC_00690]|uniref:alpha/beta fold hydrolase n=1 Tax=Streptomyces sp. NBC_00690 TaxID=2975808 RepID=UPI002E2A1E02|nr:alpha/beta fold hydrolase [Streptomyces sp. NBC_00690]
MTDHLGEQSGPTGMVRRRALAVSAVVLAGLQASTGAVAAQGGERTARAGLHWQLCSTVKAGWPIKNDTRTECAELTVPMDYAKPKGRKIQISVSRVRATHPKTPTAPIVSVLGGPGYSNISDPASMTQRGLASLNADHDLIGLDLRGTGYSDGIPCDQKPWPEPAPTTPEKNLQKVFFNHQAEYNSRCSAIDPEFVRQITPENAARDIDRFRKALGTKKINFYGSSFGTAIGMAYRALFDRRTERMWLDSPVPPTRHLPTMDAGMESNGTKDTAPFVNWLAQRDAEHHWGTDEATVRGRLGDLRGQLEKKPRTTHGTRLDGHWVVSQVHRPREEWDDAAKNLVTVRNNGTLPTPRRPSPNGHQHARSERATRTTSPTHSSGTPCSATPTSRAAVSETCGRPVRSAVRPIPLPEDRNSAPRAQSGH